MRKRFLSSLAGCALVTISALARADMVGEFASDYRKARADGRISHVLEIDNDSLLLKRDDGFYSSGMRYTQSNTLLGEDMLTSFGWRIGQELYTASDIKLPAQLVVPPDHPYAGWLYGGFFKETHRRNGMRTRYGIDIGCLGPCAGGEWTQTNLHRVLNQPLPQGWSRQVRNEIGVVLYATASPRRWKPDSWIDITPGVNARFGNIFADLGADLLVRAGRLNSLPHEPTFHAFLRADARAVGYNATLQGGYFSKNNPHTMDPKRFTGLAEAGVAWNRGPYGATVSLVRRSNEIRDLPNSRGAQNYLHLQFSYAP